LSELRFTTRPAGAGDDRFRARFFVSFLAIVKDEGEKLSPDVTVTVSLAPMKPGDDAVIVTDPKLTPVSCGCIAGVVASCGMNTVAGTVAFDGSLLFKVMVAPPTGAPVARLICRGTDWLAFTVAVAGRIMAPKFPTFTLAEPVT